MKKETAIKIAALHDGELSASEEQALMRLIEEEPEAKAYLEQLQLTSKVIKGAHVQPLTASAQWNNLRQRIESDHSSDRKNLFYFPRYAAAAVAILALGMGIWWPMRKMGDQSDIAGLDTSVYMVETELENATPVVYLDEPSGWTVVWVVEQDPPPERS